METPTAMPIVPPLLSPFGEGEDEDEEEVEAAVEVEAGGTLGDGGWPVFEVGAVEEGAELVLLWEVGMIVSFLAGELFVPISPRDTRLLEAVILSVTW